MSFTDVFDRDSMHQQKRLALLRAAAEIFNEQGYANASLHALALQLNISKAAVYYYFKNKQEILYECYEVSFDIWEKSLKAAHEGGGSGRDKLEIYIRSYFETGLNSFHGLLMIREWSELEEPVRKKIESRRKALTNRVRDIVREGITDGTLKPCDPKVAVTILGASITWLLRMYRPQAGLDRDEFIRQVIDQLLNGMSRPETKRKSSRGARK